MVGIVILDVFGETKIPSVQISMINELAFVWCPLAEMGCIQIINMKQERA